MTGQLASVSYLPRAREVEPEPGRWWLMRNRIACGARWPFLLLGYRWHRVDDLERQVVRTRQEVLMMRKAFIAAFNEAGVPPPDEITGRRRLAVVPPPSGGAA